MIAESIQGVGAASRPGLPTVNATASQNAQPDPAFGQSQNACSPPGQAPVGNGGATDSASSTAETLRFCSPGAAAAHRRVEQRKAAAALAGALNVPTTADPAVGQAAQAIVSRQNGSAQIVRPQGVAGGQGRAQEARSRPPPKTEYDLTQGAQFCRTCKQFGHVAADCASHCSTCTQSGHIAQDCPKNPAHSSSSARPQPCNPAGQDVQARRVQAAETRRLWTSQEPLLQLQCPQQLHTRMP